MLNITPINAQQAEKYYIEYYTDGLEQPGRWGGKAAAMLGLTGDVEKEHFLRLSNGLDPHTGEQLTQRIKDDRRAAYDCTFSSPKSVAMAALLSDKGDEVKEAHNEAVRFTMGEMEKESATRVRKGGKNDNRIVGNMVWSEHPHFSGRPVDGVEDLDLHTHVVVQNVVKDEIEGVWKAVEMGDIKRQGNYWARVFHTRLAANLEALGYTIERNLNNFEIAPIGRDLVEKFSRRSAQLEAVALAHGVTDPATKAALAVVVREKKNKSHTLSELVQEWDSRLTDAERKQIQRAGDQGGGFVGAIEKQKAVAMALEHSFERASVMEERQILTEALRLSMGKATAAELRDELHKRGDIITHQVNGRDYVTTRNVLMEEKAVLAYAIEGRGAIKPLVYGKWEFKGKLNEEQKAAVNHIIHGKDKISLVRGGAGTGKTTMMVEAAGAITERAGVKVMAFAPTAKAARFLLREDFPAADTIQKLLVDKELQAQAAGAVWFVDEMGLASAHQAKQVFELAKHLGCRKVVLLGDSKQHHAVERGDVLKLLEKHSGIASAQLTKIQRQTGKYKEAVAHIDKGELAAGFAVFESLGWVKEITEKDQRTGELVKDYLAAIDANKSALVVSPTHKEAARVVGGIRAGLKERGILLGEEQAFTRLIPLNLTDGQKRDAVNYQPKQVVQFTQHTKGIKAGSRFYVVSVDEKGVGLVADPKRKKATHYLPNEPERFNVYEAAQISLGAGDLVRVTQNSRDHSGQHKLDNGAVYRVAGITKGGRIRLNNGWLLDKDFGFLAHAYVSTSHASQGATVDRVFIAQSAESFGASNREQFYVSVSRGRESCTIYTDDKDSLKQAITATCARPLAIELEQKIAAQMTPNRMQAFRHRVAMVGRAADRARAFAASLGDKERGKADIAEIRPMVKARGYVQQLVEKGKEIWSPATISDGAKSYLDELKARRDSKRAGLGEKAQDKGRRKDRQWGL